MVSSAVVPHILMRAGVFRGGVKLALYVRHALKRPADTSYTVSVQLEAHTSSSTGTPPAASP